MRNYESELCTNCTYYDGPWERHEGVHINIKNLISVKYVQYSAFFNEVEMQPRMHILCKDTLHYFVSSVLLLLHLSRLTLHMFEICIGI